MPSLARMPYIYRAASARPAPRTLARCLTPRERHAALAFVRRVRGEVRAELTAALLFGSRARGDARADSDVDVLLVFRRLPPDREPQAGHAEAIADEMARATGIPVQPWSVSLPDLARGRRTPMLVDALADGVPLWPLGARVPRLPLTPEDARFCAGRLLDRVAEGSAEVRRARVRGDARAAARRARDDLVRLCTAALLLCGETRPRRGDAVRRLFAVASETSGAGDGPPLDRAVLAWAAASFGRGGGEGEAPLPPPPGGVRAVARQVQWLAEWVAARAADGRAGDRPRPAGVRWGTHRTNPRR